VRYVDQERQPAAFGREGRHVTAVAKIEMNELARRSEERDRIHAGTPQEVDHFEHSCEIDARLVGAARRNGGYHDAAEPIRLRWLFSWLLH